MLRCVKVLMKLKRSFFCLSEALKFRIIMEMMIRGDKKYFSPRTGKTMLARRLPGILPPLDPHERVEVTQIHCAAGVLAEEGQAVHDRPFRAPHHTSSHVLYEN